jgi:hypothetical protein
LQSAAITASKSRMTGKPAKQATTATQQQKRAVQQQLLGIIKWYV